MIPLKVNPNVIVENCGDQIIDEDTILFLRRMFCDSKQYQKYIITLWAVRDLLYHRIEGLNEHSAEYQNLFPLFECVNEFVGSIQTSEKDKKFGIRY